MTDTEMMSLSFLVALGAFLGWQLFKGTDAGQAWRKRRARRVADGHTESLVPVIIAIAAIGALCYGIVGAFLAPY